MAGLTYDGIPSTRFDSSTFSGAEFQGVTGSFTNIRTGGSIVAQRINDGNGAVFSAIYGATTPGSPGLYGPLVQAGRVGPLIAATGSIVFPIAFTTRDYVVTLTPESPVADGLGSTVPYVSSGITHATTGCTINAGSPYIYSWIAVGR